MKLKPICRLRNSGLLIAPIIVGILDIAGGWSWQHGGVVFSETLGCIFSPSDSVGGENQMAAGRIHLQALAQRKPRKNRT